MIRAMSMVHSWRPELEEGPHQYPRTALQPRLSTRIQGSSLAHPGGGQPRGCAGFVGSPCDGGLTGGPSVTAEALSRAVGAVAVPGLRAVGSPSATLAPWST